MTLYVVLELVERGGESPDDPPDAIGASWLLRGRAEASSPKAATTQILERMNDPEFVEGMFVAVPDSSFKPQPRSRKVVFS